VAAATLVLRADADGRMGSGHVMRSLALAHAWRDAGGRPVFVSHCPVEGIRRRITDAGFALTTLKSRHPDPTDLAKMRDLLEETKSSARPSDRTWVALDGYHFDADYQQEIRTGGGRLLVVDDLAHLERYHADVLLNQNCTAEQLDYRCDEETVRLLGCRYAMLRPEFRRWRSFHRETPETARRLLVTTGGGDPDNVTQTIIRALHRLDVPGFQARIVVGPTHPNLEALREQVQGSAAHIELLTGVTDMPALMAWADLALSAAGTTCWELALMQLPAVVFVLADNQQKVAEHLAKSGVVANLGSSHRLMTERIAEALAALCHDRSRRASQSEAGRRLVDGRGTDRILPIMHALDRPLSRDKLKLRPVAAGDVLSLWHLVNDPAVRRASLVSPDPIPWEEHVAWFDAKLASPGTRIWVLEFCGLIVGVIRYDRTAPDCAEISFHVAAPFRRRGLGTRLLEDTGGRARVELGVDRLCAIVRQENHASAQTFVKRGFSKVRSELIRGCRCYVFEQTAPARVAR